MPPPATTTLSLLLCLALPAGPLRSQEQKSQEQRRASPFSALRWNGEVPEVQVGGTEWFRLLALDGTEAAAIVAWCQRHHADRWQKRFAEDLVEVLAGMGSPPGATADLKLEPLAGGKPIEKKGVALTEANREALREAGKGAGPAGAPGKRDLGGRGFAKLAPFSALRWNGDAPEVKVGGDEWLRLVALDGVEAKAIVAWCQQRYGPLWQKRFTEDLVEVLTGMGQAPKAKVDLRLGFLDEAGSFERKDVEMTVQNRAALWEAANSVAASPPPERLSRDDALQDLAQAQAVLEACHSYRLTQGSAAAAGLERLGGSIPADGVARARFARDLAAHLAAFGDCHAGVSETPGILTREHLPFLTGAVGRRLVAFVPDRSGFVDPEHPCLKSLDGVPVDKWLDAAAAIVPKGSPQLVRERSTRLLRYCGWLREELGLARKPTVEVELESEDGKSAVVRAVATVRAAPTYGEWPRGATRRLEGDLGYLRIARMDDDERSLAALEAALVGFAATKGLVIDVRGNGGGGRGVLRSLFPYFMPPGGAPRIANVAAARTDEPVRPDAADGLLADRYLYPAGSPRWSDAERDQIRAFLAEFRPEWVPPAGEYGPWHVMLLRRAGGPRLFHYERPVVVLMDGGCFSATDVFLGAFKGWPNVTLLGTPSGGGSGRPHTVTLSRSQLTLRLSTMASFRPDGRLYDGRGIEPDLVVEPRLGDWVGATDTQLEAAVKRLRQ